MKRAVTVIDWLRPLCYVAAAHLVGSLLLTSLSGLPISKSLSSFVVVSLLAYRSVEDVPHEPLPELFVIIRIRLHIICARLCIRDEITSSYSSIHSEAEDGYGLYRICSAHAHPLMAFYKPQYNSRGSFILGSMHTIFLVTLTEYTFVNGHFRHSLIFRDLITSSVQSSFVLPKLKLSTFFK